MILPITLAIIQSLIVVVARQRFAIPLNAVHETLLIDGSEVQRSEGRELLDLRGEALPLRRLAAEFAARGAAGGKALCGRDRPRRRRASDCSSTGSRASRTP